MKKMNTLILALFTVLSFISCNKDSDNIIKDQFEAKIYEDTNHPDYKKGRGVIYFDIKELSKKNSKYRFKVEYVSSKNVSTEAINSLAQDFFYQEFENTSKEVRLNEFTNFLDLKSFSQSLSNSKQRKALWFEQHNPFTKSGTGWEIKLRITLENEENRRVVKELTIFSTRE